MNWGGESSGGLGTGRGGGGLGGVVLEGVGIERVVVLFGAVKKVVGREGGGGVRWWVGGWCEGGWCGLVRW